MNILIIGGTKFLGRYLVESAKRKNFNITLFNRGLTNPGLFKDVETIIGNRENDQDLEKLKDRDWDVVIDTCGQLPWIVSKSVKALSDNVKHYVYISSISVYANFYTENGATEESEVLTLSEEELKNVTKENQLQYFGHLKSLCEQEVRKGMGDRCFNIRPGLIVGPHDPTDRFTYWPHRVGLGGKILAPPNRERQVQFIDVRDLADWILHLVENGEPGTYHASGPTKRLTMDEFLESCRMELNPEVEFVWAGLEFLEKHKVQPWIELPLWIPTQNDIGIDSKKAISNGLVFRPFSETIRDTYEWDLRRAVEKRNAGLDLEREKSILKEWEQVQ